MSSVGQAVGGLVGGVIGFFLGGPVGAFRGFQIGMMVGGAIDPPKGPSITGPRLDDLSVQTSTYDAFIPRVYGTTAITGNIIWLKGNKLTEVKTTSSQGGKGAPESEVTTYSYYATFAVALCEGPIAGVRRIWIANQLWYDVGSDDISAVFESNRIAAGFTVYLGTDAQQPDPLIQADKGATDTPAYRGIAYIVFDSLPLQNYGNSLMQAQIKVEVLTEDVNKAAYARTITNTATGVQFAKNNDGGVGYPWISSVSDGVVRINIRGTEEQYLFSYEGQYIGPATQYRIDCLNPTVGTGGETWRPLGRLNGTHLWGRSNTSYLIGVRSVLHYHDGFTPGSIPGQGPRICHNLPQDRALLACSVANDEQSIFVLLGDVGQTSGNYYNAVWYILDSSGNILDNGTVEHVENGGGFGRSAMGFHCLSFDSDAYQTAEAYGAGTGTITICTIGTDKVLRKHIVGGGVTNAGLSYWSFTYPSVYIQNGVIFAVSYDDFNAFHQVTTFDTQMPLSSIVSQECLKSALLEAGDIDVSELTDAVTGFRVSQQGALRGPLEVLRGAYQFDVIPRGYQIKFKKRGGASVVTIDGTKLDAREVRQSEGDSITNARDPDTLLPYQVTVKYLDVTREYDVNEQIASRGL